VVLLSIIWGRDLVFCGSGVLQRRIVHPPPMEPSWNDLRKCSEGVRRLLRKIVHPFTTFQADSRTSSRSWPISPYPEIKKHRMALQTLNMWMDGMETEIQHIKAQLNAQLYGNDIQCSGGPTL
jgi:hypothetical protein